MWCNAYVASKEAYCGRANTLQAYGDVNRCAIAAINQKSLCRLHDFQPVIDWRLQHVARVQVCDCLTYMGYLR